jgi:tetratricopeptide (TPR) repeat protein
MADDSVERAQALIELGRADEARGLLAQLLAVEPNDVEALVALALAQSDDDPQASLATARQVLSLEPENIQGLLLCADACLDLNRVKEAIEYSRLAVAEAPWLAASHAALAQSLGRRARRPKEAREAAKRAIELNPEESIGYIAAGNIEMARANWKKAERWYRKALEVDPSDRTAQINLVTAQESRGKISPAFSEAAALLRLDPRDRYALDVLHETVYTTLVHLLWVATALLLVVAIVRDG